VDIRYAQQSYELLKKYIKNFQLIVDEDQGHTMTDEQIEHLRKWFVKQLE
jgi:predicted esterase